MEKLMHWTSRGTDQLVYRISSDFVAQLQSKLEIVGITNSELAKRIGVTIGRVSQVLNDPGNLTLKGTVKFARALGMKVAVVAYDDGDAMNNKGPINAEIFHACWQRAGAPRDFFELANSGGVIQQVGIGSPPVHGDIWLHGNTSVNRSHYQLDNMIIATTNSAINLGKVEMPEATQITYKHRELVEMMIKDRGIHDGIWGLFLRFGLGASNVGAVETELQPAAIIPVLEIGLQKFEKETNISVDAAKVNPAPQQRVATPSVVKQ